MVHLALFEGKNGKTKTETSTWSEAFQSSCLWYGTRINTLEFRGQGTIGGFQVLDPTVAYMGPTVLRGRRYLFLIF